MGLQPGLSGIAAIWPRRRVLGCRLPGSLNHDPDLHTDNPCDAGGVRMNARKQSAGALIVQYAILIFGVLFSVFPIYFVLQASLRPGNQLYTTELQLFPTDATLDNFRYVLTQIPLLVWL